jgi:hypothetical protein
MAATLSTGLRLPKHGQIGALAGARRALIRARTITSIFRISALERILHPASETCGTLAGAAETAAPRRTAT